MPPFLELVATLVAASEQAPQAQNYEEYFESVLKREEEDVAEEQERAVVIKRKGKGFEEPKKREKETVTLTAA